MTAIAERELRVAGGKSGAGVWQRIINQIPPCTVFVSGFLGNCAVMRRLRLPLVSIGIDLDQRVVDTWLDHPPGNGSEDTAEVFACEDVVPWLSHAFEGGQFRPWDGRAGSWPANEVLVYLDPPYLQSVRREGCRRLYRHELGEDGHRRLLETVDTLRCRVLINHPRCALYDAALGVKWRTVEYQAMGRAGLYADCLWANYQEPSALQDYRFVGRNKRQRERIRRRCRNWVAALGRMSPLERGAVLSAVGAEFGGW